MIFFSDVACVHSGWYSRYSDSLRVGRSGNRIPLGTRFSAPVQSGPEAHPATYAMRTRLFPGVKAAGGRGVNNPPLSVAELRLELFLCSPSVPSCPVLGWTLLSFFLFLSARLQRIDINGRGQCMFFKCIGSTQTNIKPGWKLLVLTSGDLGEIIQ